MDKYVRTNVKVQYTIMKDNKYFNGARFMGTDSDGILRICKTKWEDMLTYEVRRMTFEKAKDTLRGILKYDRDKDSKYKIVEITVTTNTEVNELGDEYSELINPFGDSRFGG